MSKRKFFNRLFSTSRVVLAASTKKVPASQSIKDFIQTQPQILELAHCIPSKYLEVTRRDLNEHLYLICPDTAKIIASHMMSSLDLSGSQVISETNAGLGLVSTELLERGVNRVRMYEKCSDYRLRMKDFGKKYPDRVELFTEDFFTLGRAALLDRHDGYGRVESFLRNVPSRSWVNDPIMTVVGTMPNLDFIKYLIKSLAMQCKPSTYGRIQIFAIMKPKHYMILSTVNERKSKHYQATTTLFNLVCDYELLDVFPRKIFLPWEKPSKKKSSVPDFEADKMYFVKVNFKKNLPVPAEHLFALNQFVRLFYGRGNRPIIPTIEQWVPGCGLNFIVPTLNHEDFFNEMSIFTKFGDLTPRQILGVFKETINHPHFEGSNFTAMLETAFLRSETTETSKADAIAERTILEELNLEEKLEFPMYDTTFSEKWKI